MAQQVYITGIGDDRPGVVADLSAVMLRFDANILESTMTMLGNQFTFLMVVELPNEANVEQFRVAFQPVEKKHHISLYVQQLDGDISEKIPQPEGNPFMFSIAGDDKMGITANFSAVLARHDVNIMDLNAKIIKGNNGPAYILMIEARVPKTVNLPKLEQDLASMGEQMNVEVTYHPIENVAL